MPHDGDGTAPAKTTDDYPATDIPPSPTATQDEVRAQSSKCPKEDRNVAKELASEFRQAERWAIGLNFLTLVALIFTLWVYKEQLGQMTAQTELITAQMGASAVDSAQTSKRLNAQLAELKKQSRSAQNQVGMMKEQIRLTQRPWLAPEPTIEAGNSVIDLSFPIRNVGSVPAIKVGYEFSPINIENMSRKSIRTMCDRAKQKTEPGTYLIPGSSISLAPQPRNVFIDIDTPPSHTVVGCIAYFGQFDDFHHTEVCLTSIVKKPGGPPMLIPCPDISLKAD
ncbi:MAG TPA: hypothetical protein VKW78_19400 [Terriglobales bacterium]|nr:hypothetical protein [Terriglobales bacterium]